MGTKRASLNPKQQGYILQAEDRWFVTHYPTALSPKGKRITSMIFVFTLK